MSKQRFIFILLTIMLVLVPSVLIYLKNDKIDTIKKMDYDNRSLQAKTTLKTLIKEKLNTTATIAIGLSNNESVLKSLKNIHKQKINLNKYSLNLRDTTDFKNVWFQLIDKNGISVQRSWTDYKGDRIADARKDLQVLLKNPKSRNGISTGKFDMTFKSIVPVYDNNKDFLGFIEAITHFNSISKNYKKRI